MLKVPIGRVTFSHFEAFLVTQIFWKEKNLKTNTIFSLKDEQDSEEDLEMVAWGKKHKLERNQKPTKQINKYKARAKRK